MEDEFSWAEIAIFNPLKFHLEVKCVESEIPGMLSHFHLKALKLRVSRITVDENQQKANDYISQANAAFSNRQWGEAAELYEQAAQLYSPYRTFYLVVGECYLKLQNYKRAEEIFQKLIDFSPQHDQAWWMMGQAILSQNRVGDAEDCFDKSIELGATDYEPYYYSAMLKSLSEKKNAVLPLLRKALDINPNVAKFARAETLLRNYVDLL